MNIDISLLHSVIQLRRPWLDDVMILIGALAGGGFAWVVLALIASVVPRYEAGAWRLLLTIGFTFVISDIVLKPIVDRPRPFDVLPALQMIDARPATTSMPSGHAARAVAAAIAGAQMIPGLGWVLWPFAMVVGISRVYVGVHWPSDVAAGAIVGLGCVWWVTGRIRSRPTQNPTLELE